ncbi:serine/threonine protein kinase [Roseateles sp.]|uniref:serine/threonine protein kinase n=1 Tax=Roseateles sp. TaxID=1971397 RepID=UPI003D0A80CC
MPELALPPPAAPTTLREGTALGVWRLAAAVHGVDAGPGGQWYRAQHALATGQSSAVLVLPRSERAAGVMLRFADQAHDLGQLSHAKISVPSDSGVTPLGQPYMILGWAEGQPIIRACSHMPLRARLSLVVQLCEVLRYAHQQSWLLAEVDPGMIWVTPDQRLTLMGMGLMRMPDPEDPFERGMGLGSVPGYASPEALAGEPPSLGSEVYGLGALLYMLVDGRLPSAFGGDVDEASPSASWSNLSGAEQFSLDALLHKAVAPRADRRHVSAEALADDLRAWLAGENHSALSLTPMPGKDAAAADAATETVEAGAGGLHESPRRSKRLALVSVIAVSLLVGGWLGRQYLQGPATAQNIPATTSMAKTQAALAAPQPSPTVQQENRPRQQLATGASALRATPVADSAELRQVSLNE